MANQLLTKLFEESGAPDLSGRDYVSQILRRQMIGIRKSSEFKRIFALPRREALHPSDLSKLALDLTSKWKRKSGDMVLRDEQAWALKELEEKGGLFGNLGCGAGKTLISLLAPLAASSSKALLLVPAQLKKKTEEIDIPFYSQHFNLPEIKILSYSMLSSAKKADFLEEYAPDLIICDEVHKLKSTKSARTKRVMRYLTLNPSVKFVALSGTMTKRSLKDYWHLIRRCLGPENSPLPNGWPEFNDWCLALDSGVPEWQRMDPGALLGFCNKEETPREGFSRRLRDTKGVVSSKESALNEGLEISSYSLAVPSQVKDAVSQMKKDWRTPDGEIITEASSLWSHSVELAFGFYYRWIWPDGKVDREWLSARKEWRSFVQSILRGGRSRYDSPLQVANACRREDIFSPSFGHWESIKNRVSPKTEPVWVSEEPLKEVADMVCQSSFNGLVWVHHKTVGQKLQQLTGLPYFGGGDNGVLSHPGKCIVSINAHATGKNLQRFNQNLLVYCPSSGATWEQLISRTHRPGQKEDTVFFRIPQHTPELKNAFIKARQDARYIQKTMGQEQKLGLATISL